MGSPLSLILAEMFMSSMEEKLHNERQKFPKQADPISSRERNELSS